MSVISKSDAFDRIIGVHRPNCELLKDYQGESAYEMPVSEIVGNFDNDRTIDYVLACQGIYEDLKRIIGQLAGLLILARTTERIEFLEFEQLALSKERWHVAKEKIVVLRASAAEERHKQLLETTHASCGRILSALDAVHVNKDVDTIFNEITEQLKLAYSNLSQASSDKAGMVMVDFSNACCSCGQ